MTLLLPGAFSGCYVPVSLFENVPLHVKQEVFTFLNNTSTHVKYLLCLGELDIEQQWCYLEIQVFSGNTGVSSFSTHVGAMHLNSELSIIIHYNINNNTDHAYIHKNAVLCCCFNASEKPTQAGWPHTQRTRTKEYGFILRPPDQQERLSLVPCLPPASPATLSHFAFFFPSHCCLFKSESLWDSKCFSSMGCAQFLPWWDLWLSWDLEVLWQEIKQKQLAGKKQHLLTSAEIFWFQRWLVLIQESKIGLGIIQVWTFLAISISWEWKGSICYYGGEFGFCKLLYFFLQESKMGATFSRKICEHASCLSLLIFF